MQINIILLFAIILSFLHGCADSKKGEGQYMTASEIRALDGSTNDIKLQLRKYEKCIEPRSVQCNRMLNRWIAISSTYGDAGGMSIILNNDIDNKKCSIVLRNLSYIAELDDIGEKGQYKYRYNWNEERKKLSELAQVCVGNVLELR
jgi:hypothetical protein